MDREQARPLDLPEAKARLREAADRASLGRWMTEHPLEALAAALAAGVVIGATPRAAQKTRGMIGYLFNTIFRLGL